LGVAVGGELGVDRTEDQRKGKDEKTFGGR